MCAWVSVYVDACVNILPCTADPGHNVLFAFSAVFIYAACVLVQSNLWPFSCWTLQVKNAVILDDDSSSVFLRIFCQANRFSVSQCVLRRAAPDFPDLLAYFFFSLWVLIFILISSFVLSVVSLYVLNTKERNMVLEIVASDSHF